MGRKGNAKLPVDITKNICILCLSVGRKQTTGSQEKVTVDLKQKCSIMKSSVGNNAYRKSTKESESIMSKSIKAKKVVAVKPYVGGVMPASGHTFPNGIVAKVCEVVVGATKAALARVIFDECYKQSPIPQRKDILARVQAEAGLTKHGSATYLQNYKNKNLLSVRKSTATA